MSSRPRDPETGQFLASGAGMEFDRFEEFHHNALFSVAAADLDGATGQLFGEASTYEGVQLYDADDGLDRDELGVIVWAEHALVAYFGSTSTADSTVRSAMEISFSPDRRMANELESSNNEAVDDQEAGGFTVDVDLQGSARASSDVIGRVLEAVGFGPITDGTNGVGGAGTAGVDSWEGRPVAAPTIDARDEVYANGVAQISNASDLAAHWDLTIHHVVGVLEDFF